MGVVIESKILSRLLGHADVITYDVYIHLFGDGFEEMYNKYHSYARVAREIGRSASCVRYNVMMKNAPKVVRDTFPDAVRK